MPKHPSHEEMSRAREGAMHSPGPATVVLEVQNTLHESREPRTMKIQPWLQGTGLAMLYLLPLIAIFFAPAQIDFYHQVMPITSLTRAALLDLLLLGLLFGGGLVWLNAVTSRLMQRLLWIPVLFVTAWITERGAAEFVPTVGTGVHLPGWAMHLPWMVLASSVLLLILARRYYDIVVRAAEIFLMSAGIAAIVVILPRLVLACFNHAPPEQASFTHPVRQPWHAGQPRVVWLLFDELSYDQTFEHLQPGIELPAFTQLNQQSLSFSQLVPVGNLTEVVIPGLLSGQHISEIKSNHQGALLWRSSAETGWRSFNPDATVFAAARQQGWGTGVVGWFNPYCRLLATTVDSCYWTYQEFTAGGRFNHLYSQRSTLENARDALPFVAQLENAWHHTSRNQAHRESYHAVLKQAKSLIEDQNIRFAFIHLPVPHTPGIFPNPDPHGAGSDDYLGNLMLADQTLAELRAVIAKTSAASDTILIVSSDHSWRVPMWRNEPGWTKGEERASSGGQFDPRPVLMVHFPGETSGESESVDRPQSAMIVHTLLLDIFAGKISNLEGLKDGLKDVAASSPAAATIPQTAAAIK
jgi:hypothetical protein